MNSFGIEDCGFCRGRYLGVSQNLVDAPCDHMVLRDFKADDIPTVDISRFMLMESTGDVTS